MAQWRKSQPQNWTLNMHAFGTGYYGCSTFCASTSSSTYLRNISVLTFGPAWEKTCCASHRLYKRIQKLEKYWKLLYQSLHCDFLVLKQINIQRLEPLGAAMMNLTRSGKNSLILLLPLRQNKRKATKRGVMTKGVVYYYYCSISGINRSEVGYGFGLAWEGDSFVKISLTNLGKVVAKLGRLTEWLSTVCASMSVSVCLCV